MTAKVPPELHPRVSVLPSAPIAQRYLVERSLGRGGMGSVYAARDQRTGKLVALKRLQTLADPIKMQRSIDLFEREYYTLAHLKHPHVVEVFDYGISELGPYYTMELLDSGGLEELSPLPWQRACAIARGMAAALSLVHARRMVFRDLNPRNVRCDSAGEAKLIDFGTLCSMGQSQQLVGTPAYCAPEAVDLQPLDARTDLYSLGATLYFALTGRHAYPARSFEQLRQYWSAEPKGPRELNPEIPEALDALVMHLLHADLAVRPGSAAEVVERLLVIEGKTAEESTQLSTAYLTTPTLVGRDALLARVRRRLERARGSRGSALLIEGPAGVGRSRALAACLLEAKLVGALAVRADASDTRDWIAMRSVAEQLLRHAPESSLRAAAGDPLLLHILPELQQPGAAPSVVPPELTPSELRARSFEALRRWLFAVAREQPLLITVDDLHKIDEPSAAALALLLRDIAPERLLVVAGAPSAALREPSGALRLYAQTASSHMLQPLSAIQTEELLRSVFGDVPHLTSASHELFAISAGNPRDLMDLAQALVSKGLAQHHSGVWSLPAQIDTGVLPSSMLQELQDRVARLSPLASSVLSHMAMADDRALTFEEHAFLCASAIPVQVNEALSELTRAQLAAQSGATYALQRRSAAHIVLEHLEPEHERSIHALLAQVFSQSEHEEVRRAYHLFHASEERLGLEVLLAETARSQASTDADPQEFLKLTAELPSKWFECYSMGLELCAQHERPTFSRYMLSYRVAGLIDVMNVPSELGSKPLDTLIQQLSEDSGLADWAKLDPAMDPMERLKQGIGAAQARHEACPEAARGYDPITAIRVLVRSTLAVVGQAAKNLDWRQLESLPSLAPLVVLSPAVGAVHKLAQGVTARTTARFELARTIYLELVEQTSRPDATGLGESHQRYLRYGVMFGLGVIEANLGLVSALRWADEIEGEPMHRINAQLIRMMHALWQGQVSEADRLQREIESMRLRDGARQWLDGASLVGEAVVNALSDDLTRVKRTCESIEPLARRQRPWAAVLTYAEAEHQRICGDLHGAKIKLESLVNSFSAGQHQIWPNASGAYVRVLSELGELEQARTLGQAYLRSGEDAGLGQMLSYIKLPLAIVLSQLGDTPRAEQLVHEVLAGQQALGSSGLNAVLAYETAARIALMAGDFERFEALCGTCEQHAARHNARSLLARCEKLKRRGRALQVRARAQGQALAADRSVLTTIAQDDLNPAERAQRILHGLVTSSGARGGMLYLQQVRGLVLSAQTPEARASDELKQEIDGFMFAHTQHEDSGQTRSLSDEDAHALDDRAVFTDEHGDRYRAVLLSHQTDHGFVVSGVVVLIEPRSGSLRIPGAMIVRASELAAMSDDAQLTLVS